MTDVSAKRPAPAPVATMMHTVRTFAITAGVMILAVGWPLGALSRWNEIQRSTLGYQLRLDDPVLVVTGVILVSLIVSILMSFRPLRRYAGIREVQTGLRTVIADSYFGQGHYREWTYTHPESDLASMEYPDPADYDDLLMNEYEQVQPERVIQTHPTLLANPEPVAPPAPTVEYVVQRRDSWRRISEAQLGDAERAAEIRELNLGRIVAPGVALERDTALRSGWVIVVPSQ